MRLYLLTRGTETLAIEVNHLHGGSRLDEYSRLVNQLVFATPK